VAFDTGVFPSVFASSRRVIILDDVAHPTFDDAHITHLLRVSEDYKTGALRVRVCSPALAKN
jgi:hypothetical protein